MRSDSTTLMTAPVTVPRANVRRSSPSASPSLSPRTPNSPIIGSCSIDSVTDSPLTFRSLHAKRPNREPSPNAPEHQRTIDDYVIVADIGRGAYGLVKKARLRGVDGEPQGDQVIIKYIIKSRILADCWRRHRILGPIPIEIHVMDQLCRLPYVPPSSPLPWSPARARSSDDYRAKSQQPNPIDAPISKGPSHPNICKMIEFFEDHEFYYMVMPCFGAGQDLFAYVESVPNGLDTFQVRSIFGQVADALRLLHANKIVHRDVKDENVILDGHGNAQLIDFGSAAHVRPGRLFDTFSGTLDYASAEILRGEKYAGQAQDVWALGVVGYVLLCGECPFRNGQEAIEGLAQGSRAAQTLKERCLIATADGVAADGDASGKEQAPMDPAWSPAKKKRKAGQEADGGGALEDAADLITRCLEVDADARPTTEQICHHRFLAGQQGWTGPRGWPVDKKSPDADDTASPTKPQ